MRPRLAKWVVVGAALLASACASGPPPQDLVDQARVATKGGDFEGCYRLARQASQGRQTRQEAAEAIEVGAYCHKRLYLRERLIDREYDDSPWLTTEQTDLFEWLATFFEGEEYPEEIVNETLAGYPYRVFALFREFAAERPALARFDMKVKVDNGIIEYVTIRPDPTARY